MSIALALACLASVEGALAQEGRSEPRGFRLGAGDVVTISVWKNDELSVETPVLPDGAVTVPLVGQVQAEGLTAAELTAELSKAFSTYLTAPSVSVVVTEINSMKIFVTGRVEDPGAYDAIRPLRLMQAIALAGGVDEFASGKVVVLRDGPGGQRRIEADIKKIVAGRSEVGDFRLQPGDTVYVP